MSKDLIYIEIGKRIRNARKDKNLTQKELANQVNLTRSSIANIEQGRQKILLHVIYDFSNVLNIPINKLIPSSTEVKELSLSEGLLQLHNEELSNKELSWIEGLVKENLKRDKDED